MFGCNKISNEIIIYFQQKTTHPDKETREEPQIFTAYILFCPKASALFLNSKQESNEKARVENFTSSSKKSTFYNAELIPSIVSNPFDPII